MHECAVKDSEMVERFSAPNTLYESSGKKKGIMDLSLNYSHRELDHSDSDGHEVNTNKKQPKKKRKSKAKKFAGWLRRTFCG